MPLYKRQDLGRLLADTSKGTVYPVYLLFGDRFLCQSAATELTGVLLPAGAGGGNPGQLTSIDGDQENVSKTLALLKTYSLFARRQVFKVTDTKIFLSKGVSRAVLDRTRSAALEGDAENSRKGLAQLLHAAGIEAAELDEEGFSGLSPARWKKLFGFAKPQEELAWLDELLTRAGSTIVEGSATAPAAGDPAALYEQVLADGLPPQNILLLLAETVDKRKKLFKFIQEHGCVLDLSVESGAGAAARKDQQEVIRELVKKTLAGFGKSMEPAAFNLLLERVGFHPVAAVMETEKLALSVGEARSISAADLDAVIGHTREEALYELTEAFTAGRPQQLFGLLARLREQGIHGLAVLATFRNHIRKTMLIRALQQQAPAYSAAMPFNTFQQQYLPAAKEAHPEWQALLWSGHPYALFLQFRQACGYELSTLRRALAELLRAEYRFKGSGLPDELILDLFFLNLLLPQAV